jgi:hypothetical protein
MVDSGPVSVETLKMIADARTSPGRRGGNRGYRASTVRGPRGSPL